MGTQQEQDQQDQQEKAFGFEIEELDPAEEARLRGEELPEEDDQEEENQEEDDGNISAEILEKIAGDGSPMVPHARFHEVNERVKDLERQLAERDSAAQQSVTEASPDIADMELKHYQLLLDGAEEEAVALRLEINKRIMDDAKQAAKNEILAEKKAESARAAAEELNSVIASLEKTYPALDVNSKNADAFAIDAVNTQMQKLMAEGKSPADALSDAVSMVAERLNIAPAGQQVQRNNNQQKTIVRNAKAAEMQPPRMNGGMGDRALQHGIKPISQMSDKEFNNMDPELERKLRGEA